MTRSTSVPGVFHAVARADRDVGRLVRTEVEDLLAARDPGLALAYDPMPGPRGRCRNDGGPRFPPGAQGFKNSLALAVRLSGDSMDLRRDACP